MGLIIRGARIASRIPKTPLWTSQFRSASRATYTVPIAQPTPEDKHWNIPSIAECPSPTCQCRETPQGLDIDRESKLNGTMPAYAEQVIISTGRSDWKSRIQEDEDSVLVNQMAKLTGPKGKFSDVCDYHKDPSPLYSMSLNRSFIAIPQCVCHQLVNPADALRRCRAINTACTEGKHSTRRQTWLGPRRRSSRSPQHSARLGFPLSQLPIRAQHSC